MPTQGSIWLGLLIAVVAGLVVQVGNYLLARTSKAQDRRAGWFDIKDRVDEEYGNRLRDLEYTLREYQTWRQDLDTQRRTLAAALATADHRLGMVDWRLDDLDRVSKQLQTMATDHLLRLERLQERLTDMVRVQERLDDLKKIVDQQMVDIIRAQIQQRT